MKSQCFKIPKLYVLFHRGIFIMIFYRTFSYFILMYDLLSLKIKSDGVKNYNNKLIISNKKKKKSKAKRIRDPTIAILSLQVLLLVRT